MAGSDTGGKFSAHDAERDPRPTVRLPAEGLPGAAIAILAAFLALLLFLVLNARRRHAPPIVEASTGNDFPAPPPLALPPIGAAPQPPVRIIVTRTLLPSKPRVPDQPQRLNVQIPPPFMPTPSRQVIPEVATSRLNEPALVVDTGTGQGASNGAATTDDAPVRATVIRNRSSVVPAGTLIPAVLETPIDSTRPGLVRAVTSDSIRGFDGRRVLLPRGSRLIGEYQSDVRAGQNRVLITWTRLIRPDGVAIRISSPTADPLGEAGIAGHVNSFFFQRFVSAVLQTGLTAAANIASRPGSGSVIVGLPAGNAGAIGQDLVPGSDLKPRIKVRQGAVLTVFVARDLELPAASAD